jgi:predicted DNA-binding WGR domain protein
MMGLPSASTLRRRGADSLQTFGFVFAGLEAVHLVNREMDRYLDFLKLHRGHALTLSGDNGSEEMRGMPQWSAANEPADPPRAGAAYVEAYYGVFCQRCSLASASKEKDHLRRFKPTILTREAVRCFLNQAGSRVDDEIYRAGPLSIPDLESVSLFMQGHRQHEMRVQLLRTAENRLAFLPKIAPPAVAPPSGKARRFEMGEGMSRKFWRIWLDGCRLNVHFGRVGAAGQMRTRVYTERAIAEYWMNSAIGKKKLEGYAKVRDRR